MKKLISILLVLAVLLPAAACADFPLTTENVTFTVFGQRDQNQAAWADVYVLNEYEKMTGVHMDWKEIPAQGPAGLAGRALGQLRNDLGVFQDA